MEVYILRGISNERRQVGDLRQIGGALFNTSVAQADLDLAHDAEWVIFYKMVGLKNTIIGQPISSNEFHWP